ncbi:MAG: response regulator [Bdellovibrionales bacterium]|nr:response regulator [Bdellovibrionales bacterium]
MRNGRKKIRLLLVDEQDGYFELLRQSADIWNERFEFECQMVRSATEAIQKLSEFQPSVIICDTHLSDMSCVDFVAQLSTRKTPVVVASNENFPELREELIQSGALDCIAKTDDPDDVELLLEELAEVSEDFEMAH